MRAAVVLFLLSFNALPADEPQHQRANASTPGMEHQHAHGGAPPERLGRVDFKNSCSPEVQKDFQRAVALLHSFWYDEAEKAFEGVAAKDPSCAVAWWGVAMSNYHPLWAPPSAAQLAKGRGAVAKARAGAAKSERERGFVEAIGAFYDRSDALDHRERALAYEKAMERVAAANPTDHEAAIFYALALDGTAPPTDKTYANQKKAGEILARIMSEEPEHPGIAHYVIHSYDAPPLAPLALDAARHYAKIAPSSPHALHMPSHIFTRLGLWQESIDSNLASAAAGRAHAEKTRPGFVSNDELHALDYLEYAYLQGAEDAKAKAVVARAAEAAKAPGAEFQTAYALAAIPARYALERRDWKAAAALPAHPESKTYTEAITRFARALGASRSGGAEQAKADVAALAAIHDALVAGKVAYWTEPVEVQRRAAAAWLAHAEKRDEEALALMRSAADHEDSTEKHPVTPGQVLPARELLGDLLLELGRPADALAEYEASLKNAPRRFNSLAGAAKAARLAGDAKKALSFSAALADVCAKADGPSAARPALEEARAAASAGK